ncbi:hypothetical protein IWX50DRAFT_2844 [Phyllosticta citricarpa]
MAAKQSLPDEGASVPLVDFDRSPSPLFTPRMSLEPGRKVDVSSSTTLISNRTLSPAGDSTKKHVIETLKPASAVSPQELVATKDRRNLLRDIWAKEIFSMALSIGCIVAVAVILKSQDNKPLSSWPLPWQPSSVVSFITTISRAALIFPLASCISQFKWHHFRQTSRPLIDLRYYDAASRGPLGSLSFIFRVTFKSQAIIASLCCLLTIAALSMETFVQQTIDYPVQSVLAEEIPCTAQVSQTYNFDSNNTSEETYMQLSNLAKALETGIFGQSPFQTLTCPTANCTWTNLTTMGLCSSCENVTLTTKQDCYYEEYENTTEKFVYHTVCNYETPQGVMLDGYDKHLPDEGYTPGQHVATLLNMLSSTQVTSMNMSVVKNPVQLQADPGLYNKKLEVFQCKLAFCARTFPRITSTNGEIQTEKSADQDLTFEYHEDATLHAQGPKGNSDSEAYFFRRSEAWGLIAAFGGMFAQRFDQQSWIRNNGTYQPLDYRDYMYAAADIPKLFDDLALAITDFFRTVDPIDVPGQSFQNVTFVQVHWPWFIGPLLIELGAALLLASCIVVSARQKRVAGTQIWKDSVFPFLFNGIDRGALEGLGEGSGCGNGNGDSASQMERRAARVRVRLQREGEGEEGVVEGRLRFV